MVDQIGTATGPATGMSERGVQGIIMDYKYHATCLVAENVNGVGDRII